MNITPFFVLKSVNMALAQIWANKTRSFLTALGIIVGVASVTAVIAALTGLKAKVLAEFETVGAARIFVFPDRPENSPRQKFPWEKCKLKIAECQAIQDQCPSVKGITPLVDVGLSAESDNASIDGINVNGIWPAWHDAVGRKVIRGRPFTQIDVDTARQVALLNESAIEELKLPADPLGSHVLLGGRRFLVVGVVETLQAQMFGMNSSQAEIFIPFSVAEKLLDRDFFMRFAALAVSPEKADEAKAEIEFVMRRQRGLQPGDPNTFRVAAIDQYINQFKTLAAGVTAIAGGIVGISLLVGGIGIMNIMLVSVTERTREIGLRMAVGARGGDILSQFLVEAVTLSCIGGAIGVALGVFAAEMVGKSASWRIEIQPPAILLAFGSAALIGIFFGFYPARKASQLEPIEALRYE
jgi:putative ABC transport system permease protein